MQTFNYIHVVTSVKIDQNNQYSTVIYKKGNKNDIVFRSGLYQKRDGAVYEVLEFLKQFPYYINEWVN